MTETIAPQFPSRQRNRSAVNNRWQHYIITDQDAKQWALFAHDHHEMFAITPEEAMFRLEHKQEVLIEGVIGMTNKLAKLHSIVFVEETKFLGRRWRVRAEVRDGVTREVELTDPLLQVCRKIENDSERVDAWERATVAMEFSHDPCRYYNDEDITPPFRLLARFVDVLGFDPEDRRLWLPRLWVELRPYVVQAIGEIPTAAVEVELSLYLQRGADGRTRPLLDGLDGVWDVYRIQPEVSP